MIIVLFSVIAFLLMIVIYDFYRDHKMKQQLEKMIDKNNEFQNIFNKSYNELMNIFEEKNQIIKVLHTANLIGYLMIYLLLNNEDKYSFYYQKLFFLGVPKEILSDFNKLNAFLNDLSAMKYHIEKGETPYQYKYVLKENREVKNHE